MAWNKVDSMFEESERTHRLEQRTSERKLLFNSLQIDKDSAIKFYRLLQDFLLLVDKELDKLTGHPSNLVADKFHINYSGSSLTLTIEDYWEKGDELSISLAGDEYTSVSWAGPSSDFTYVPITGLTYKGYDLFLSINLYEPRNYVYTFSSQGYISAFVNGVGDSVDHEYSLRDGKVCRWKP